MARTHERRPQDELVRLAAGRDADAFAELFETLSLRMLLFVRGRGNDLLGPDCSAEDVLQTVLARIWELLPGFEYRGPGAFYRWVITIAERGLSDRVKYLNAKGRRGVRHVESNPAGLSPQARAATSVAMRAARREEAERLIAAIDGLAPDRRAVIDRQLQGRESLAESAAALGISKTTAWNRLQQALEDLRLALDPPG